MGKKCLDFRLLLRVIELATLSQELPANTHFLKAKKCSNKMRVTPTGDKIARKLKFNKKQKKIALPVAIDPQYSFVMKSIQFYKYSLIP